MAVKRWFSRADDACRSEMSAQTAQLTNALSKVVLRSGDNSTAALTQLLPSTNDVLQRLDIFRRIAQTAWIPHVPDKVGRKEISPFLDNVEHNATKAPDMLALLFAALALVQQVQLDEQQLHQHVNDANGTFHSQSECYSKITPAYECLANYSSTSSHRKHASLAQRFFHERTDPPRRQNASHNRPVSYQTG